MDPARRDLLVSRIISGSIRCSFQDHKDRTVTLLVKRPSRDQAYYAQELYQEVLAESHQRGCYTDEELLSFLYENGLWDNERQAMLEGLPKDIEEFKLKLFKMTFRASERKVARKALAIAKSKLLELTEQRNAYNHLSCSGAAWLARSRYTLGCSLYHLNGNPVFTHDSFWEGHSDVLEQAVGAFNRLRLEESEFRDLARNEPWRSIWMAHKHESSIFGVPAADLTDEQKSLVCWTSLYDGIFGNPECPSDEIIADDDMLDGWMIDQRRRREAEQTKKAGDELLQNDKIRNSQEVFIVADSVEDAKKIDALNDTHGSIVKKQRFNYLKQKGEVNELDMPDTKQRLRMELNKKFSESVKAR